MSCSPYSTLSVPSRQRHRISPNCFFFSGSPFVFSFFPLPFSLLLSPLSHLSRLRKGWPYPKPLLVALPSPPAPGTYSSFSGSLWIPPPWFFPSIQPDPSSTWGSAAFSFPPHGSTFSLSPDRSAFSFAASVNFSCARPRHCKLSHPLAYCLTTGVTTVSGWPLRFSPFTCG